MSCERALRTISECLLDRINGIYAMLVSDRKKLFGVFSAAPHIHIMAERPSSLRIEL
jgi:hypothetical protein